MDVRPESVQYARADVSPGATLGSVTAEPSDVAGRPALRISVTEAVRRNGTPGVDFVDQPTFVILPLELATDRLEVDISSDLLPDAPDHARAFAGLAFTIAANCSTFEGGSATYTPVRPSALVNGPSSSEAPRTGRPLSCGASGGHARPLPCGLRDAQ